MSELQERLASALSGRYRIERELGHGGMAIVFLARDEKHNREVAIKVLRPELAAIIGAERFLAEIETTAQLQHPHILPLYDSGEADTFLYYVMPYVEGESLEDLMARERQLPIDQAVRIGAEVADALSHAHERGVIHRDVKPANVLLQDGRAMVADFGISLAVREAGSERMTETGLSLGTPNYMSPEQATADRDVDARSDVYSLGAMVYEMLAGRPPHAGASLQSVIASVLTKEPPPVDEDRSSIPAGLAAVVHRAIARLPADRYQSAGDFREELLAPPAFVPARGAGVGGGVGGGSSRGVLVGAVVAAGLAGVAVGAALLGGGGSSAGHGSGVPARFSIEIPRQVRAEGVYNVALARDGSMLAFTALDTIDGQSEIFVRPVNSLGVRSLDLAGDADSPSFDPTGRYLAYFEDRQVRLYDLELGRSIMVGSGLVARQGAWADDGDYYFILSDGIYRVGSAGGEPEAVWIAPAEDLARPETLPLIATKLPGSDVFVYGALQEGQLGSPSVFVLDPATGERKLLVERGTGPRYLPIGVLTWQLDTGELMGAPFDLDRLELTGEALPVATDLAWDAEGQWFYSFSESGALVYEVRSENAELVAVALDGSATAIPHSIPGSLSDVEVSPDGRRVAVQARAEGRSDEIWILDIQQGSQSRLTVGGGENWRPTWHPDGNRVAFVSDRAGARSIWERPIDVSEPARQLVSTDRLVQQITWTSNSDFIYREGFDDGTTLRDLYTGNVEGTAATPFVQTPFDEFAPAASPDGRWVAYVSRESGRDEVYLNPWPGPGGRVSVSNDGGVEPAWSPDGQTLYYRSARDSMVATTLDLSGPSARVTGREALFPISRFVLDRNDRSYSVRPDGEGFVMIRIPETREFVMVTDWFTEVREILGLD